MQYNVNMSLLARDDLNGILSYSANKLCNKTAATDPVDELEKKILILQKPPSALEAS